MAMLRSATFSLALCLLACLATAEENESKGPDSEQEKPLENPSKTNGPVNFGEYKPGDYRPAPPYRFYGGPSRWQWPAYYGPAPYGGPAPDPYNFYYGWGPQNLDRGFQRDYRDGNGDYYSYGGSGGNQDKKERSNDLSEEP
uniref:Putative secreted protein n=1 Tax=Amblyomma americanum TaxID=6943 RepID=A0A0C9R5C7_AMBAM